MSPSAVEMLDGPLSLASHDFDETRDITIDSLVFNGGTLRADIIEAVTSAEIERTIEGASVLTITLRDPYRQLIGSDLFDEGAEISIDTLAFELVKVQKSGDDITLTFEDKEVARLRRYVKPKRALRGKVTRAQFAKSLVNELKPAVKFFCPELETVQPIGARKPSTKKQDAHRKPGFAPGVSLTVKGIRADSTQVSNMGRVLAVGVSLDAPRNVLISAIATIIVESTARNISSGDRDSTGLFQQRKSQGWPASRNIEKDSRAYFVEAIKEYKRKSSQTPGQIAANVQRPKESLRGEYTKRTPEAKRIVEAYNGAESAPVTTYTNKPFFFARGEPGGSKGENSWDALKRLAEEVAWRCFVNAGTVYFVSEEYLFQSRPRLVLKEDDPEVDVIDFDYDAGKSVATANITCRAARWSAPPGTTVLVDGMGKSKVNGRWLVSSIRRSLFSTSVTIVLKQPIEAKPEPAADTNTSTSTAGAGNSVRDRMVEAAQRALREKSKYVYAQVRPYPSSLFLKGTKRVDCSSFVTLIYKAVGAKDPNRAGYDGSGNTGTLVRHGKWTSKPRPGDLGFWRGSRAYPGHVAMYVGNGEFIGIGSVRNGVTRHDKNYISGFLGYMTYEDVK